MLQFILVKYFTAIGPPKNDKMSILHMTLEICTLKKSFITFNLSILQNSS